MSVHAEFSPSRLPLLQKCPLFVSGPAGAAADRGTEIDRLITETIGGGAPEIPIEFTDQVAYALEQFKAGKYYISDDSDIFPQYRLSTPIPGVEGTADLCIVDTFRGEGLVIDWKSGYSDRGHAADHLQLIAYAIGAAIRWKLDTVHVWLVELDKRRTSKATFWRNELLGEQLETIASLIKRVNNASELDAVSGPACKWCVKNMTCPAVVSGSIVPVTTATLPVKELVETLTPERVAEFLDLYAERIELAADILSAAKAKAHAILEAGGEIPGWMLVNGRKSRKWENEAEAAHALEQFAIKAEIPLDDLYDSSLKSPAQAEKIVKNPGLKSLVASLVTVTTGKKLVKEDVKKLEAA